MGKCVDCKYFNCIDWTCDERRLIFDIHKENACSNYKFNKDDKLKNEIDEALKHRCINYYDIELDDY